MRPEYAPPGGLRVPLGEIESIDRALYGAVAGTPTPRLDGAMRRISSAANYSRLSIASAAVLAIAGGSRGRRAAGSGLASVAATSASVNLIAKHLGRRRRPDRVLGCCWERVDRAFQRCGLTDCRAL